MSKANSCEQSAQVCAYVVGALPEGEARAVEAHVAGCVGCRGEMDALRGVVATFTAWPTDVVRPTAPLWDRIAQRVADDAGQQPLAPERQWTEPEWEEVAPGISCKLLASDPERDRVSMLVRLEPGVEYPPHTHAGFEELHLLHGELWIDDRKLVPGDYNHAPPGTSDQRVWSETGCTCVLVTSPSDVLR